MLAKYRDQGFEVVSPNVEPGQDSLVAAFMKGNGYAFTPIRDGKAMMEPYGVRGTPTNFLIDARGRVVFKPRVHDLETERTLELEIEALLRER